MENKLVIKTEKEIKECLDKQISVCEKNNYPHFAPRSGRCWKCNRNIYQNYEENGRIRTGETGEKFITGCPFCCTTYCD